MSTGPALTTAVVLRIRDGSCDVIDRDGARTARFAPQFPTPHTERVSPGNLVALATDDDDRDVVLWRWFDAVLIDAADEDRIVLWEPAHGEVTATLRPSCASPEAGSRVFASSGLPGADWWAAAAVPSPAWTAAVDLDEVAAMYSAHGLWTTALAAPH